MNYQKKQLFGKLKKNRAYREYCGANENRFSKAFHTPRAILLENIDPCHQHIDLIFFAKIQNGSLKINKREAEKFCWFNNDELDSNNIAADIKQPDNRPLQVAFHKLI